SDAPNVSGWLAGGQLGFNWLIDGSWLVGVEADGQATGASADGDGTFSTTIPVNNNNNNLVTTQTAVNRWSFPWFATLRGRVGGLAAPGTLVYVTGGLAVGEFKFASETSLTSQLFGPGPTGTIPAGPPVTIPGPAFAETVTRVGGAAGIGVEQKFTPNWSARLEYLYIDFGSHTFFNGTGIDTKVVLRENIVRFGVNYTFPPPGALRY